MERVKKLNCYKLSLFLGQICTYDFSGMRQGYNRTIQHKLFSVNQTNNVIRKKCCSILKCQVKL